MASEPPGCPTYDAKIPMLGMTTGSSPPDLTAPHWAVQDRNVLEDSSRAMRGMMPVREHKILWRRLAGQGCSYRQPTWSACPLGLTCRKATNEAIAPSPGAIGSGGVRSYATNMISHLHLRMSLFVSCSPILLNAFHRLETIASL